MVGNSSSSPTEPRLPDAPIARRSAAIRAIGKGRGAAARASLAGGVIGRTVANAQGHWSVADGLEGAGSGRFFARSEVPADPGHPRVFVANMVQVAGT